MSVLVVDAFDNLVNDSKKWHMRVSGKCLRFRSGSRKKVKAKIESGVAEFFRTDDYMIAFDEPITETRNTELLFELVCNGESDAWKNAEGTKVVQQLEFAVHPSTTAPGSLLLASFLASEDIKLSSETEEFSVHATAGSTVSIGIECRSEDGKILPISALQQAHYELRAIDSSYIPAMEKLPFIKLHERERLWFFPPLALRCVA